LMSVSMIAVGAQAQGGRRHLAAIPPSPRALGALQQDLIIAIDSMKSALPIYDGNRVKAIHASHEALVIVDNAISGASAMVRTRPVVKDHIPSGTAHSKYTPQEIATSQTAMKKAYSTLQQAWKDLQTAAGSNPNQKAKRVATYIQTAGNEVTKALALHGG